MKSAAYEHHIFNKLSFLELARTLLLYRQTESRLRLTQNKTKEVMKMLKKLRFVVFLGVLLACFTPLTAGAYTVNFLHNVGGDGNQFISPYAGVTTEDFEGSLLLWSWSDNFLVRSGDDPGKASAPFGVSDKDASKYVTVPKDLSQSPQSALAFISATEHFNYFGIWWGSVDSYNTIKWYNDGGVVAEATVVGNDVSFPPVLGPGNQTLPATNLYVNFLDLPLYDSFRMFSTSYAFEADNISIARVPEPTTMLLLGLGLLGVAGIRRKFQG